MVPGLRGSTAVQLPPAAAEVAGGPIPATAPGSRDRDGQDRGPAPGAQRQAPHDIPPARLGQHPLAVPCSEQHTRPLLAPLPRPGLSTMTHQA
jgi:hypothetical protein